MLKFIGSPAAWAIVNLPGAAQQASPAAAQERFQRFLNK
jgi:hypothetical protein